MSTRFEGYAAIYDTVDRAGEVIRPGAFACAGPVPLLMQHRGQAVGAIERLESDARGLRVAGRIDTADAAALVRAGAIPGLSIGYRPIRVRQGARRELLHVDLVEVSLVAVPLQPGATITRVVEDGTTQEEMK